MMVRKHSGEVKISPRYGNELLKSYAINLNTDILFCCLQLQMSLKSTSRY